MDRRDPPTLKSQRKTERPGETFVISVFRGGDYIQAQLLKGLLEQQGIGVFLQGAALQGGLGEAPAVGYLSIMVDEADVSAAKVLLARYERGELSIDEGFDDGFGEPDGSK